MRGSAPLPSSRPIVRPAERGGGGRAARSSCSSVAGGCRIRARRAPRTGADAAAPAGNVARCVAPPPPTRTRPSCRSAAPSEAGNGGAPRLHPRSAPCRRRDHLGHAHAPPQRLGRRRADRAGRPRPAELLASRLDDRPAGPAQSPAIVNAALGGTIFDDLSGYREFKPTVEYVGHYLTAWPRPTTPPRSSACTAARSRASIRFVPASR